MPAFLSKAASCTIRRTISQVSIEVLWRSEEDVRDDDKDTALYDAKCLTSVE